MPQPVRVDERRWVLFVHQLPSHPSNLRVRTWRRLQQLGALPLKQAVYVLPDSPAAREDFEWLKTEVAAMGGDATVLTASSLEPSEDQTLIEEFRRASQEAYQTLTRDIDQTISAAGRRRRARPVSLRRQLDVFRDRLARIDATDFFVSAGRDRAVRSLEALAYHTADAKKTAPTTSDRMPASPTSYRARLWVTRPRPGVDRMASAWLIRRFIDPEARFAFVAERSPRPPDSIAFDMFDVEFTHRGADCTFETLCDVFGITEPAIVRVAQIVHDVDLKDGRFGAGDAPTVESLVEGLRLAHHDDDVLLSHGMALFESLYRVFQQAQRPAGPRAVASTKRATRRPRA